MTTTTARPASPKQIAFITRLAAERGVQFATEGLTSPQASQTIDQLLATPKPAPVGQAAEVGVYSLPDGQIVKINQRRDKQGFYALRWVVIGGQRVVDDDGSRVHGEWEYDRGLISQVTPEMKMNLDEAKAFILRYGQCPRCARTLKAAESVERGIGPVCVKYFTFG